MVARILAQNPRPRASPYGVWVRYIDNPVPITLIAMPRTALALVHALLLMLVPLPAALAQQPAAPATPALPAGLTTTASGLQYVITGAGTGAKPLPNQVVIVHYTGSFLDGKVFDSSVPRKDPFAFTLGRKQVIKGWDEAFALLRVGDKATLVIPADLAYGDKQRGPIPANSTLRFDVELLDIKPVGLADILLDTLDEHGLEGAMQRFADLKTRGFGPAYVSEAQLNGLGYRLMSRSRLPHALAVMHWALEIFPNSGNLYDSQGEVLRKSGLREEAIRSYEKALALDPANENAKKMLAELRTPASR